MRELTPQGRFPFNDEGQIIEKMHFGSPIEQYCECEI